MRPTFRTWVKHLILLLITLCTATVAGVIFPFGTIPFNVADPQNSSEAIQLAINLPLHYLQMVVTAVNALITDPRFLTDGLSFSLSLLFILLSHEMGHYIACRLYGVDSTLPFFIPTPPMIGPAGTFGAFIKIMSPMPSRRAVFDIGVVGPIAGFIALLPVAVIGIATMRIVPPDSPKGDLTFTDPLLMHLIGFLFEKDPSFGIGNPFYYAAWVGLLVTALNLIPSGQLDGGHAIYAVLGKRVHFFTGRIAFVAMTALAISGFLFFNSPSGFLVAKRKVVALLTLVIFALSFVPFAIRVN